MRQNVSKLQKCIHKNNSAAKFYQFHIFHIVTNIVVLYLIVYGQNSYLDTDVLVEKRDHRR